MSLRTLRTLFIASTLLSVACDGETDEEDEETGEDAAANVDTDGDGVTDADEATLGTDPNNADSDGDGLSDGDEVAQGTNPAAQDTDGDTYWDSWELAEGTDPNNADSRIYQGYWPYNPNKDALGVSESSRARPGELTPRFQTVDQFGDVVDIYDFAGQGKYIIVDLSGAWCYWCHEVAKMLESRPSAFSGYESSYPWIEGLPPAIEAGDIYFLTYIDANSSGGLPDESTIASWYNQHPNEHVPVLLDDTRETKSWMAPSGYPTMILVGPDMIVDTINGDYTKVLDAAWEALNE